MGVREIVLEIVQNNVELHVDKHVQVVVDKDVDVAVLTFALQIVNLNAKGHAVSDVQDVPIHVLVLVKVSVVMPVVVVVMEPRVFSDGYKRT